MNIFWKYHGRSLRKSGKNPDKLFVSGNLLPNYMTKLIMRLREKRAVEGTHMTSDI
jgi:hypothetical protein